LIGIFCHRAFFATTPLPKSDTLKGVATQTKAASAACKDFILAHEGRASVCEPSGFSLWAFQTIGTGIIAKTGFLAAEINSGQP
jgi:hypothetical protein